MKKEALKRALLGFPIGIAVSVIITLIISVVSGDGVYYAFVPSLAERFGGEVGAAAMQTLLSGLLGAGCAALSVIWELGSWSIAKQSGVFFLGLFVMMMPAAYVLDWMEHSVSGFASYFAIFFGIFVFTWISQYIIWKQKIRRINKEMAK